MRIEYLHASKFGNGAIVAAYFKEQMAAEGVDVDVRHIKEMTPAELRRLICTCSARRVALVGRSGGCAAS